MQSLPSFALGPRRFGVAPGNQMRGPLSVVIAHRTASGRRRRAGLKAAHVALRSSDKPQAAGDGPWSSCGGVDVPIRSASGIGRRGRARVAQCLSGAVPSVALAGGTNRCGVCLREPALRTVSERGYQLSVGASGQPPVHEPWV